MSEILIIQTNKTEIIENIIGRGSNLSGEMFAKERIITVNNEIVFKDYQRYNHIYNDGNTAELIDKLFNKLSDRQRSKTLQNCCCNCRKLSRSFKFVWPKFLYKLA